MGKLFGRPNPGYAQASQLQFQNPRQPKALPTIMTPAQMPQLLKTWQKKLAPGQRSGVAAPAAPANFTAAAQYGGVLLTWNPAPGSSVDGYILQKSYTGDFSTNTITIPLTDPQANSYFDPQNAGHSVMVFYRLMATAGSEKNPHSVIGESTATLSAQSLNSTTGFGKNLLANPGFEMNTIGTPTSNAANGSVNALALNGAVSDGWQILSLNGNPYPTNPQGGGNPNVFTVMLESGNVPRTGDKILLIRVNPNVSIPASSPFYEARIVSGKIPVKNGDIIRVTAFERWDFNGAIPAGLTIIQRIGVMMFDKNDSFISELISDNSNNQTGAYSQKQGAVSINVANVAYIRVQCSAFLQNTSGAPVSTSANFIADLRWDDLSFLYQNTAFDLTPLNTNYLATTVGNVLSQSGTTSTVNVAGFTLQYGDGQVGYNSGSVNAPSNSSTGYVLASDPTYSGGAVAYSFSTQAFANINANGNIIVGKITLSAGGGGTGGTGGGGTVQGVCFTPDTPVVTKRGIIPFSEIKRSDYVMTRKGWRKVQRIVTHNVSMRMVHMGGGFLVTHKHQLWHAGEWTQAAKIWADEMYYHGAVMNLMVNTKDDEARNYLLGNGWFAHNVQKF